VNHFHVSTALNITGTPDKKTIGKIAQATQYAIDKGVKQAVRNKYW
jgi:hypothetical protein